jgi:hypothetical protein
LEVVIPPEILDDELYSFIRQLARESPVKTILEIGSSSGEGSTRAFVEGLTRNPHNPHLYCLEISKQRYTALTKRYANTPSVTTYNLPSVSIDRFPTAQDITEFYHKSGNPYGVPLSELLRWLHQDIRHARRLNAELGGIQVIKRENKIENFGIVLVDGSEFTGYAELNEVMGADFIILDDVTTFKNAASKAHLLRSPSYSLLAESDTLRHGFAIFQRIGAERSPPPSSTRASR